MAKPPAKLRPKVTLGYRLPPADDARPSADPVGLVEALDQLYAAVFLVPGPVDERAANQLAKRVRECLKFVDLETLLGDLAHAPPRGNPASDWIAVKKALRASANPELARIAGHLDYLVACNRGKRISLHLSEMWQRDGQYTRAREALDAALAEDQILGNLDDPPGPQVMTIHKSKAKQFDGVIVLREGVPIGPR